MPDASGNLLGIDEFTTGRQVRFYSYLDPDVVLSMPVDSDQACVHRMSSGPAPTHTIFTIERYPTLPQFTLTFTYEPGWTQNLAWVSWDDGSDSGVWLRNRSGAPDRGPDMEIFTIDMVDSVWFALNNSDHSLVADVSGSDTGEGNQIIGYEWNGGHNQMWRAQLA